MSEDASYGMITIAVEDYEDGNQVVETPTSNTRGLVGQLLPNKNAVKQDTTQVSVSELQQKMSGFLGMVARVFSSAEKEAKKTAGMCLDEIELSVEIGAEGEIRLIGSGAKANGKGAIKLKFKRVAESK